MKGRCTKSRSVLYDWMHICNKQIKGFIYLADVIAILSMWHILTNWFSLLNHLKDLNDFFF